MRIRAAAFGLAVVVMTAAAATQACGGDDGATTADDGGDEFAPDSGSGGGDTGSGDTGSPSDAGAPCQGLQCRVVTDCGATPTTLSGTVYDPAGNHPIYNALVYIPTFPNDPLPPIMHGATCETCASKLDNAMATALTDANGNFTITNAPQGANIPLVVQLGKWRRLVLVPSIAQCTPNTLTPPTDAAVDRLRLPATQGEGEMPRIALTTGCDPMELELKQMGIASSEFRAQGAGGAVTVFQGNNGLFPVDASTSAYTFWDDATEMQKYDLIINSCQCALYPRDQGPKNLGIYLNAGGRFFGTHYELQFFADDGNGIPSDLHAAAAWNEWGSCGDNPQTIDTTLAKGAAMSAWLKNIYPASTAGQIPISTGCATVDMHGTTLGLSNRLAYSASSQYPSYVSVNTPTTNTPDKRCGRTIFSDVHVGAGANSEQGASIEFVLLDLLACVQDDATTPTAPAHN